MEKEEMMSVYMKQADEICFTQICDAFEETEVTYIPLRRHGATNEINVEATTVAE